MEPEQSEEGEPNPRSPESSPGFPVPVGSGPVEDEDPGAPGVAEGPPVSWARVRRHLARAFWNQTYKR